jgi:predicted amidohydrolase YtcJ
MSDTFLLHGVPVHVRFDRRPVEAIGVADGRVLASGSLDQVRAAMPPGAPERRLDRGVVLPAFVDPHQHAFLVAVDPGTDLLYRRARDIAGLVREARTLVAAGLAGDTRGGWLRLHGYEPLRLAERRSPTARELDAAAGERPMHVLSRTFHESAVSGAGLDALQIGRRTPDPAGGRIVRDRRGRPTGVLLEAASFAAEAASRRTLGGAGSGEDGWRERLGGHGRRLATLGVVRIGDGAVPAAAADAFTDTMAAAGVAATPLLIEDRIDQPALRAGGTAKILLDGGEACHLCMTGAQVRRLMGDSFRANIGPRRGLARAVGMRSGFPQREADRRWHTGVRWPREAGFGATLREAARAGSGLAVHAVGNGAVDAVLAGVLAEAGAASDVRLRVEHAMIVDPRQVHALAATSIPVVTQPGFLASMGSSLTIVPLPRPLALLPIRSMLAAGVRVAFGSDYPAAALSPWDGIASAVTRVDDDGLVADAAEAIDVAAGLDASTRAAAVALGDGATGTLEAGSPADLAWWDGDPFAMDPARLPSLKALGTWRDGRMVYAGPDAIA